MTFVTPSSIDLKPLEKFEVRFEIETEQAFGTNHRMILVDWMFDVSCKCKFFDDTIHYAVSFLDRFLLKQQESVRNLQLLGATCLWIASKYNEISTPTLNDFVFFCAHTYTEHNFLNKEAHVLQVLNFELAKPTIKTFLMNINSVDIHEQADLSLMEFSNETSSTKAKNIIQYITTYNYPKQKNLNAIRKKYKIIRKTSNSKNLLDRLVTNVMKNRV